MRHASWARLALDTAQGSASRDMADWCDFVQCVWMSVFECVCVSVNECYLCAYEWVTTVFCRRIRQCTMSGRQTVGIVTTGNGVVTLWKYQWIVLGRITLPRAPRYHCRLLVLAKLRRRGSTPLQSGKKQFQIGHC